MPIPNTKILNRFGVFSAGNILNENNIWIVAFAFLSLSNLLREKWYDTFSSPGFADEIQMYCSIGNGPWCKEDTSEFLCPLETTRQNW